MTKQRISVTVKPSGRIVKAYPGARIWDVFSGHDLNEGNCGGKGKCGKCKVIVETERNAFPPPTESELKHLSRDELSLGYRLACETPIPHENIVVALPSIPRAQPVLQSEGLAVTVDVEPAIKKYPMRFAKGESLDEGTADSFLREQHGLAASFTLPALSALPQAAEKGRNVVTFILHGADVIAVEPGDTTERCLGLAVDVGTTKLAAFLVDLGSGKEISCSTLVNPQSLYGADVMSRIAFAIKRKSNLTTLQKKVLHAVNQLIIECCARAGADYRRIYECIFVGNPCMVHLLLGLPPKGLAFFPYRTLFRKSLLFEPGRLPVRLSLNPSARIFIPPLIAGFVGSDTVAAQLAAPDLDAGTSLLIDIGTNTEIVLTGDAPPVACSCASGPAFEGMHISCGGRADAGSIDKIWIDPETLGLSIRTINGGKASAICGSGIVSVVAELLRSRIIGENGKIDQRLSQKTNRVRRLPSGALEFVIAKESETAHGKEIVVSQNDILEVQKAKAAIYTGWSLLLKNTGLKEADVDKIMIAGAFGQYLDKRDAIDIGMIPRIQLNRIIDVGNAAGTGAKMMLISLSERKKAEHIAQLTEYYELAVDPDFFTYYASSMFFHHPENQ